MSMVELISSYSSLNLLTFLFRRKPEEKSKRKNDLIPRNGKFAIYLEFLTLVEFLLSRIHMASELLGLTIPFYTFTDPRYLSYKEKCSLISKVLRASKCHKISGEKKLAFYLPQKTLILPSPQVEKILFNQTDVLSQRSKLGNVKIVESTDILAHKSEDLESKCNCPPALEGIVPPDFSNSFNLNSSSDAESLKLSNQPKESDSHCKAQTFDESGDNLSSNLLGKSNLEIYSSQLISIVKEVLDIVKEMEERDECDEAIDVEEKLVDSIFAKEDDSVEEHRLLDEGIYMNDDSADDTKKIQEILGVAFSSKNMRISEARLQNKEFPRLVCDPPCSIWCDAVKKNKQNVFRAVEPRNSEFNAFGIPVKSYSANLYKPVPSKPLCKRSLSVNDCLEPKQENFTTSSQFRGFDPVSREKLILLRRDPVTYFKIFGHKNRRSWRELDRRMSFPLQNTETFMSDQLSNQQCRKSTSVNCLDQTSSGMWGPFDGINSLWQPLPECIPSVEQISKQNHKRVRDLRRQKSLN